jgi:lipopolysaccharide transport system permease protein
MKLIKSIWDYRGFILGSVKRDFQFKYLNSLLGIGWMVLQPLSMIAIYTIIFSQIMQAKFPGSVNPFSYSIYLCAGILTWGLFSEITSRAMSTFIENANLLKKINFPRVCLPAIIVLNACLNFGIIFSLFTLFLLISGNFPGLVYISVFPLLLILILLAIGLGITLGVVNIFFRDVSQFYTIFLQFWFWLTPIVYLKSILPAGAQSWIGLNPLEPLIAGFHASLVQQEWPNWLSLIYPAILAIILGVVGMSLFRKHAGDMMDEL